MAASKNIKQLLKRTRLRRKAEITLSTGDVIEFYFDPLTEAEDDAIRQSIENDNRNNAYALRVLVKKAEYEDGEKIFNVAEIGMICQEYAKADVSKMMVALIDNGGVLAGQDPKSSQGGDKE